jgi:nitrate/nitrite-specific signal transduction histidine kinase
MATDGEVSLVVSDQGCGFDLSAQARGGSLGIASMYERAQLAGGTISVQSCKGEGTQIVLLIPLSHDGEKPIANLVTSNPFIVTATTFQNTSERE